MASWDDKSEGDDLEECNVCLVKVCKKRMTVHLMNCIETNEKNFNTPELAYLVRCPLYQNHIIPRAYLNHHLEHDCEEAQNLLRKIFQKNLLKNLQEMPANFLEHISNDILNKNNKHLLFILKRDLEGNCIADDRSIYPEENDD